VCACVILNGRGTLRIQPWPPHDLLTAGESLAATDAPGHDNDKHGGGIGGAPDRESGGGQSQRDNIIPNAAKVGEGEGGSLRTTDLLAWGLF